MYMYIYIYILQQRAPIKFFSFTTQPSKYYEQFNNICTKFHKKTKSSEEIEKNTRKKTNIYPKMASRREGHTLKILF